MLESWEYTHTNVVPFFMGEKEDSSSFPLKWGKKILTLQDKTKPSS